MNESRVFLNDAYCDRFSATVVKITENGLINTDRTNFYATSGGQPADRGWLERTDGSRIRIEGAKFDENKEAIYLVPADDGPTIEAGETVECVIDWDRRYQLMKMHTACHLLSVVCPYPITSANVGEAESRVDFDLPDASVTKENVTAELNRLISDDHVVYSTWISEAVLDANPEIIRSKNVRPPRGAGDIRLVCIGDDASVDSQPCGGTHVRRTGEIGEIHIGKIEKKGRENRRFRIRFGPAPQA